MFDHSKRSKDRHRMVMLVMLILMPTDAAADNAAATDQYVGPVDLVGPMGSYLLTSSCFRDTTDPLS